MSSVDKIAAANPAQGQQPETSADDPSWWPIEPPGRGTLFGFVAGFIFGALAMRVPDHPRLEIHEPMQVQQIARPATAGSAFPASKTNTAPPRHLLPAESHRSS